MRTDARSLRSIAAVAILGAVLAGGPGARAVVAQGLDDALVACGLASSTETGAACGRTLTGMVALGRGLSASATSGSHVIGSASTLGKRFASAPRWALTGEVGLGRLHTPSAGVDGGGHRARMLGLSSTLVVGLTEGFSPQPTVGGLFAIDLLGTLGRTWVDDPAVDTDPVHWGYGVRLGVLRESFTLPGVSISAMRVHQGGVSSTFQRGGAQPLTPSLGRADIESSVTTSVRATVGKEFLALGLLGGLGWDRTELEGDAGSGVFAFEALPDGVRDDRVSFFGSVSRTWLIAQMALEVAYVRGLDLPAGVDAAGFDPSGGAWLVSLGTRLTF